MLRISNQMELSLMGGKSPTKRNSQSLFKDDKEKSISIQQPYYDYKKSFNVASNLPSHTNFSHYQNSNNMKTSQLYGKISKQIKGSSNQSKGQSSTT